MSTSPSTDVVKPVVIIGGGRMGLAIATLLQSDGTYAPLIVEQDYERLKELQHLDFNCVEARGTDSEKLTPLLKDADAVICAAPASIAPFVARMAVEAGCHYVDLCEDPVVIEKIADQAGNAVTGVAPGCGLAPGYVSLLVDDMIKRAGPSVDITAYVGVLPAIRTNRLGYGNMWGIDGLLSEYARPCKAIVNGHAKVLAPLQELEQLSVDATQYEAFTTAGSLDDLVDHYQGKVQGLMFKTLRYPGHLDYFQFLQEDLRLSERPYMLKNLLLNGLQAVQMDKVIIHIVDHNDDKGNAITKVFEATEQSDGYVQSAVSTVAAAHACATMDILVRNLAPRGGLLHHTMLKLELLGKSGFMRFIQPM